jgi:hypothetical protein
LTERVSVESMKRFRVSLMRFKVEGYRGSRGQNVMEEPLPAIDMESGMVNSALWISVSVSDKVLL